MPRFARTPLPGALHHIISRFVNQAYRFTGDTERHEYLARLARALTRTDWCLLGYGAVMVDVTGTRILRNKELVDEYNTAKGDLDARRAQTVATGNPDQRILSSWPRPTR